MILSWFAAAHAHESMANVFHSDLAFVPRALVSEIRGRFLLPSEMGFVERLEGLDVPLHPSSFDLEAIVGMYGASRWSVPVVPSMSVLPTVGPWAGFGPLHPAARTARKTEAVELFPALERTPMIGIVP